jgi:hypothetical protein
VKKRDGCAPNAGKSRAETRIGAHNAVVSIRTGRRPAPPAALFEEGSPAFIPAPDLVTWARETFVLEGSVLENPDHAHLADANIGALWTRLPRRQHQRQILATTEVPMPPPAANAWTRGRWQDQMLGYFPHFEGELPDFVLTFWAQGSSELDDLSFCALVEHELYHCGQALDEFGSPKFDRETGRPKFAIKGHDVEEHFGVVERYGTGAIDGSVARLVEAARRGPSVGRAAIAGACGTCLRRAA